MRNILLVALLFFVTSVNAQDNEKKDDVKPEHGFKKENLFTGGSANFGLSSYSTNLGISPQFGYSLTRWADVALTANFNYVSQRDPYSPAKIHQTVYGPGAFVRLFPVNFLFATVQYEYNFIHQKTFSGNQGFPAPDINVHAPSLLLGAGYAGGKERGTNTYYFFSVTWDVLGNKYSPYIDGYDRAIPVIRAGYNIGLFQGQKSRGGRRYR